MGSRRRLRGSLSAPPVSPTPAGQQLRPPAPTPAPPGKGQRTPERAHTQMAREKGKVSSRFNQITNIRELQTGTVASTPMHAPAPKATGQRARRARGGGPGHGERGARAEKPSRVFSMEISPVPGTADAGQGTREHPRHPGDSPERTRADGQTTGAANKERGSGAGLHRGARQRPAAPRDPRPRPRPAPRYLLIASGAAAFLPLPLSSSPSPVLSVYTSLFLISQPSSQRHLASL